jgi:hypothetical protein
LGFLIETCQLVAEDIRAGRLVQLLLNVKYGQSTSMRSTPPTAPAPAVY